MLLLEAYRLEDKNGSFSGRELERSFDRNASTQFRELMHLGYATKSGLYKRPMKLTMKGREVCIRFQRYYLRLERSKLNA